MRGLGVTSGPPAWPPRGLAHDTVGDRHSLVLIGMISVWLACVVFGITRLIVTLSTGMLTPWWANAIGAVVLTLLYLWYRLQPQRRSPGAAFGTALVATFALLAPVAYAMTSTVWWLGLVGFAMVMLGRRGEAWLWGIAIPVLVTATSIVEPAVQLDGAAGEPALERILARACFTILLVGMAAAFRHVAEQRARALHDSEQRSLRLQEELEQRVRERTAELRQSREVVANILNSIPQAVFWKDTRSVYLGCNRVFAAAGGLDDPEKIVGRNDFELPWRDQAEVFRADDREVMETGIAKRAIVEPVQHSDGRRPWVSTSKVPLTDESGTISGVLGVFEDITERKQAEEALRASEERFSKAFFGTPVALSLSRLSDGCLIEVNQRFIELFGFSREQLIGHTSAELGMFPDPTDRERLIERLRATGSVRGYEMTARTASGGLRRVAVSGVPISASGEEGILATMIDVTEQREAESALHREIAERRAVEEALRASEARLFNALKAARMGHWEYDVATDTFTFDDGFYAMLRTTAEREGGYAMSSARYAGRFVHPDEIEAVATEIRKALEATDPSYSRDLEHRIIFGDGEVGHVAVHFAIAKDDRGHTVRTFGVNQDITEQKRAAEALRHAQKMEAVGRLAGGVAHDFNNLLQAMLGDAHMLLQSAHDPAAVERLGRELAEQIDRGASLTRQLLLFSRRETARPQRCDLNEIVRHATRMLRRLVRANIVLTCELAPEPLAVEADCGQLDQVLVNLVVNASDAMPEGGVLRIRTAAVGPTQVLLAVEDTGYGIPKEIRDRIFEPFFTTKDASKGTGLGLSVVHGIVDQAGGNIEVESASGTGTVFKILFPRTSLGAPLPVVDVPAAFEPAAGHGERVLVVEDEDAARQGLLEILTALGYDAAAVASGEDAGALPAKPPFDLLLTDLMLPGIAGPELAVGLHERWPQMRVILMSGYAEDEAVRRGVRSGQVRFLQKPFDIATLARELRSALDEDLPGLPTES